MTDKYDWRYENSITRTKEYFHPNKEEKYNQRRTNKVLSNYVDTVLYANAMNTCKFIDDKMHYDYLFNSIRSKKRFFKKKKTTNFDDIALVSEYYKYNRKKAEQALKVLSENQINIIKEKLQKGGVT